MGTREKLGVRVDDGEWSLVLGATLKVAVYIVYMQRRRNFDRLFRLTHFNCRAEPTATHVSLPSAS
jgi:hypothetical protein